jgi:hypothetical protein
MTHTPGFPRSKLGEDERLRNAAPELLEALKTLRNYVRAGGTEAGWFLHQADNAIAKAEGKP